jgi:hypothetical protein
MLTVYAGDVDLEGNGQLYNVSFIIIHEDRDDIYINDIALLKVCIIIYGRQFINSTKKSDLKTILDNF